MSRFLIRSRILLSLFWMVISAALASDAAGQTQAPHVVPALQVTWSPLRITNGSPCIFTVITNGSVESITGTWLHHEIRFFRGSQPNTWYGFAGVDVDTPPGAYTLELSGATSNGSHPSLQRTIAVGRSRYPKVTLQVPQKFVAPSPEQLQQIEQDKVLKAAAFAKGDLLPEWSGNFAMPVEAEASDSFGTARVFNGKVASVHRGTDFRVTSGTSVRAANDGEVVLASPLFFEGNCVVIDHGDGIKTIYMHLSEIRVKPGERVTKGQVIALSGGTGRATGPHLHLAVRWEGAYLDPTKLLGMKMPQYRRE